MNDDDFCIEHGGDFMRNDRGHIPYCSKCEPGKRDFDEAARIVESLVSIYPDRPPEDIYRCFCMVFGDATLNSRIATLEAENAELRERKTPATRQLANLANAMWQDAEKESKELTAELAALKARLAEAEGLVEALGKALKPFAAAVFNDNGDMTVGPVRDNYESCCRAYGAVKRLRTYFAAHPRKDKAI